MIGGAITPANMDRACWKPRTSARMIGVESLRPKKGAARLDFCVKGRLGMNKKA